MNWPLHTLHDLISPWWSPHGASSGFEGALAGHPEDTVASPARTAGGSALTIRPGTPQGPLGPILFLDGVHRLNTNILFYEILLIGMTFILFQAYSVYLKGVSSSETFLIIFTNVIAIIGLIESYDWLLTIINYELVNMTLYLIVSMKNGSEKALSASLKYFLLSALTTTFLLLFITLIYAITGTIHWDNLGLLWIFLENEGEVKLPLFFMLITIFFKIAAAPFHNWFPDLLDAIPTVLTSWIATVPKYGI